MALHSVSLIYPDQPSSSEIQVMRRFLELFGDTISCPTCKDHFRKMYAIYTARHPEYLNSKQDLAMFIFRAHNTVNKRLDKPVLTSVADCLENLKLNTVHTSMADFRHRYIQYLIRNWQKEGSGTAMIFRGEALEMLRINSEYFNLHEIDIHEIVLYEDNVVEYIEDRGVRFTSPTTFVKKGPVGVIGGKLRLARR
jgi:hypothetical protein